MMIGAMGDFFSFAVCEGERQAGLRVIDSVCACIGGSKIKGGIQPGECLGENSGDNKMVPVIQPTKKPLARVA
ncbi:hypothetical protein CYJ92_18210 [Enterobacter bugandensis]|nr:hypothetical protein CYJ92_18210 [Enterobacter bugandensis]PLA86762.1 hypothetical protein CYK27_19135 [Enterobacter bugandensis]